LFVTEKVIFRPAESLAVGLKLYGLPAVTCAGGVPEIFTGSGVTVTVNSGSTAVLRPSVTKISMLEVTPAV
jgi:hypothetical protein